MQEGDDPLTLSEIAENAAFSMSDVAFIAGLEERLSPAFRNRITRSRVG